MSARRRKLIRDLSEMLSAPPPADHRREVAVAECAAAAMRVDLGLATTEDEAARLLKHIEAIPAAQSEAVFGDAQRLIDATTGANALPARTAALGLIVDAVDGMGSRTDARVAADRRGA